MQNLDPVGHEWVVDLGEAIVDQAGLYKVTLLGNRLMTLRARQRRKPDGWLPCLKL
jgi:hypothetical protein